MTTRHISNKVDRAALTLALDQVLKQDPDPARREQVRAMLKQDGWLYAARFAAFHCQCEGLRGSLELKPWQPPPCDVDLRLPEHVASPCGLLLLRMRALGSRYHPSPLEAVASAEQRAATGTEILSAAARVAPLRPKAKPTSPPPPGAA